MSIQTANLAKPAATELAPKSKKAAAPGPASKPLNVKSAGDQAIRVGAYLRWEAAGKPEGDGVNFWLEAEKDLFQILT